ncbi:hypothetical protein GCM10027190_49400 [Spirosoma areae]
MLYAHAVKAQLQVATPLLAKDVKAYVPLGLSGSPSIIEEVNVTGQSFDKALRINTFSQENLAREIGIILPLTAPVKKGDVLWLTFQARSLKSTRESGEALVEVRLDELINGKYEWPSFMERGLSIGSEWLQTSIPIEIKELPFHSKSNGQILEPTHLRLLFRFDKYPQILEIGPVSLLNYGPISVNELPRTVVRYAGDDTNAPWRKEAADRIEKIRKGDLAITVVDKKGRKIPNAAVSVRMQRSAFTWGTCSSTFMLTGETPGAKMYRDTLLQYFNQVVFDNELKWKNWAKIKTYQPTVSMINWLNDRNISVNGSVVVWPSWKHSPIGLDSLKTDTVALRKAVLDRVRFVTTTFKGKIPEWDVINEPTYHHTIIDIVGKPEIVKWYKAAHEADPKAKLFLNDFTMFHIKENNADGVGSDYVYNTVKYLVDNGAPIHAIAEQAHIGGTPPGIPLVLERLDTFSKLKLPISISEFDIYSDDDDFKANYLRDFVTAIYSHPAATGFTQWGFWAGSHWLPMAALWNKDWTIRKHGKVYTDLVTKTWWTNLDAITAANGTCQVRGFCGDYDIRVTHQGKTTHQKLSLDNKGANLTIKLD